MNVKEAAKILDVTERTIINYIKLSLLSAYKDKSYQLKEEEVRNFQRPKELLTVHEVREKTGLSLWQIRKYRKLKVLTVPPTPWSRCVYEEDLKHVIPQNSLPLKDAAECMGISESMVYYYLKKGHFPHSQKIGKLWISLEDIEKFMERK